MRSAKSACGWVEIKIIPAAPRRRSASRGARSNPLSPASVMSMRMTSGCSSADCRSASAEVEARPTTRTPCPSRRSRPTSRNERLSPTMRTLNVTVTWLHDGRCGALQLAGTAGCGQRRRPAPTLRQRRPRCQPLTDKREPHQRPVSKLNRQCARVDVNPPFEEFARRTGRPAPGFAAQLVYHGCQGVQPGTRLGDGGGIRGPQRKNERRRTG